MPTIIDTLELVKKAHGTHNSMDKGGKTPYHWHLIRVMLRLNTTDEELLHIALLHDIVEDTDVTLKDLKNLGYSERVIEGVKWSSKNLFPELNFAQWMKAIGQSAPEDTVLLKIADISDNLGFERMNGLRLGSYNKPIIAKKKKSGVPLLREKIDKKVEKKMRLRGEMGVYDRYYKGWNLMFENEKLIPLIDKVFTGDFCNIEKLTELSNYLSKEELSEYLMSNKIHTWTISGTIKIIQDSIGQDYVAADIEEKNIDFYNQFLSIHLPNNYFENKIKRDKGKYHITIINSMSYGKLKKFNNDLLTNFLNNVLDKKFDFYTYGIGKVENNNEAYFVICENAEIMSLREKLNISSQDFHITLAFNEKDVFGIAKNRKSLIYNNNEIWSHLVNNLYPTHKKNKP